MKITINSKDTLLTVDTYQTFDMSNVDDIIRDDLSERGIDFDNYNDIEYNSKDYLRNISQASVDYARENYINNDGIILSISDPISVYSPKYYNYTTDSYNATWEISKPKLKAYILGNLDDYIEFLSDEWVSLYSDINTQNRTKYSEYINNNFELSDIFGSDDYICSMIDYYIRKIEGKSGFLERYYYHIIDSVNLLEFIKY